MRLRSAFAYLFSIAVLITLSACATPPQYAPPAPERADYRSPEDYFSEGMRDFKKGEYREAIEDFDKALRMRPNYVEAHYFMGLSFQKMGRFEDAERAFVEAIRYDSRYLPARESLGLLLFDSKRYKQAEEQLEMAKSLGSTMPLVYYVLGEIEMKEKECNKAIAAYREALRLDPSFSRAREDLEEAEKHCRSKTKKSPAPPRVREEKQFRGGGKAIDPDSF